MADRAPQLDRDTFDLSEAAEYLRIGYQAMQQLVESGEVPALHLNQKHWCILKSDLQAWIREKAKQQQAERRAGIPLSDNVSSITKRKRNQRPDLDALDAESNAAVSGPLARDDS